MKNIVKRLARDEKGAALVLVLVLLLMGGLIIAPLLAHMGTGLITGEVYERRADELYAADAGVEDAIWKIQHGQVSLCPSDPPQSYTITDVNGKKVEYTIEYLDVGEGTYKITSIAVTDDGSGTAAISGTQIEAYITTDIVSGNYSGIMDNVITSRCDYTLQGGQTEVDPPEGEEHGPEANYSGAWPTADLLSNWYWEYVKDEIPYDSDTLDVKDYAATGIGPLCWNRSGTLYIKNSGTKGLELKLNGTVYITDDTCIGTTGQEFTLNLNGQTIFVESATGAAPEDDPCNPEDNKYALKIGHGCTLTGSGCIIAVGNIEFKPTLESVPTDYIFVLSVRGKTYMQPNGDFYGTLAGSAEVYIQNGEVHWWDSPYVDSGLVFPYGGNPAEDQRFYSIASWEVSPI